MCRYALARCSPLLSFTTEPELSIAELRRLVDAERGLGQGYHHQRRARYLGLHRGLPYVSRADELRACCKSCSYSRTAANTYVKLKDKHPTDYYKWIGA